VFSSNTYHAFPQLYSELCGVHAPHLDKESKLSQIQNQNLTLIDERILKYNESRLIVRKYSYRIVNHEMSLEVTIFEKWNDVYWYYQPPGDFHYNALNSIWFFSCIDFWVALQLHWSCFKLYIKSSLHLIDKCLEFKFLKFYLTLFSECVKLTLLTLVLLTLVSTEPIYWLEHTYNNPKGAKPNRWTVSFKHILKNFAAFPKKIVIFVSDFWFKYNEGLIYLDFSPMFYCWKNYFGTRHPLRLVKGIVPLLLALPPSLSLFASSFPSFSLDLFPIPFPFLYEGKGMRIVPFPKIGDI
jgi:hypothetical protein